MPSDKNDMAHQLANAPIRIAVINEHNLIVAANDPWYAFAEKAGLATPDAGVGMSYLSFCVGDDGEAVEHKLSALLSGKVDCFLHHYDCGPPDAPQPYVMFAGCSDQEGNGIYILAHMTLNSANAIGLAGHQTTRNEAIYNFMAGARREMRTAVQFEAVLGPLLLSLDELRKAHAAISGGVDPNAETELNQLMYRTADLIDQIAHRD